MDGLHPAVASWFAGAFPGPTEAQRRAAPPILSGESLLLASPTGSGKTLAAFLAVLSRLHDMHDARVLGDVVRCVYISPLKALASDVARNLAWPLEGIARELGGASPVRVGLRTGETPRAERERMLRHIPHILVTTPESLALVLSSPRWREPLEGVRFVIVDEVHALAETKRGAHLALSLERLEARCRSEPQRVGLSATVRPLEEAARFLTGGRPCRIESVDATGPCDVTVESPHPDPMRSRAADLDDAIYGRLHGAIQGARTTIVFTNTRASAEGLVLGLRARFGEAYAPAVPDATLEPEELDDHPIAPHHGSMSREERQRVEARLVSGDLRCVVASSSLELGVHVDAADQVVLFGSPKSAARALQRVGRSGHATGRLARGLLLASDPDELLEAVAVATLARRRDIEALRVPAGGLDVLCQHLVAAGLDADVEEDEALDLARRAWPYRGLTKEDLRATLDHLEDVRMVRRDGSRFRSRGGHARMHLTKAGGTIPRGGLVKVFHEGRFVGEVEEAFAETLQPDDVFQLAGTAWRVERSDGSKLHVASARGTPPTVPAWRSEGISATPHLADAVSALLTEKTEEAIHENALYGTPETLERLREFLTLQARFLPLPAGALLVEPCLDDAGRRVIVLHAALGRRATEALGRALAPRLSPEARHVSSELGCALILPTREKVSLARLKRLFEAPLDIPDLEETDLLRRRFRHVAERAFLLRDDEAPLTMRQRDAQGALTRLVREQPDHPLVREARREALEDAIDLPRAEGFRRDVEEGTRPIRIAPARPCLSPVAACILVPRQGGVASWSRLATLRDHMERCEEWVEKEGRPAVGGGNPEGRLPRDARRRAKPDKDALSSSSA